MIKLRTVGLAVAAAALLVECAFIPSEASALVRAFTDPPTTSVPGPPGGCSGRRSNVIHRGYPSVYPRVT
jgi:hypothetical protein